MRYNLYVLIEVVRKKIKYVLFFYIMLGIDMFNFLNTNHSSEDIYMKVLSYVSLPTLKNVEIINKPIVFFYIILIVYIILSFILYEKSHSYENIALRFNSRYYFESKIILIIIVNIIYIIFYFFIISLFLSKYKIDTFFICDYILYIMFNSLVIFTILHSQRHKTLNYFVGLTSLVITTLFFSKKFTFIAILVLTLYNKKYFNIRLLFNE